MPQTKITDVRLKCSKCGFEFTVGEAFPDVDGNGRLGCPICYNVIYGSEPKH